MAGVTFHLLQNPDTLEKLNKEVRSAFKSADEITIASVSRLPYLLACLNEGLRRYPPAVSNLPRDVHEGGEMIAGEWVHENVSNPFVVLWIGVILTTTRPSSRFSSTPSTTAPSTGATPSPSGPSVG